MSNKYFQTVQNMLVARLNDLNKGAPVQPPAAPPPMDNMEGRTMELFVPYAVQEFPRTFLHMLAKSDEVPEQVRTLISEWLNSYDAKLNKYMHDRYGDGVSAVTNTITRNVMKAQHDSAEREAKRHTDVTIDDLEQMFRQEGHGGQDT